MNMEGYDPLTGQYLGNQLPLGQNVATDDYMHIPSQLGMPMHQNLYGNENYPRTNEMLNMGLSMPENTDQSYITHYDDFHQDTTPEVPNQEQTVPESASIERDNELLSFQPPTYIFALLDYSLRRTSLSLNARLHGMFFMADPPSTPGFNTPAPFPELTCYRRNLFQVTGSITLPRNLRYIVTEVGDRLPIMGQELQISATESVEGHPVKLISVPWKTPIGNAPVVPEDKSEKEPTIIPLDIMSNQDMDADFATFPIAWKRLQFRIATANNGRRRELQQHFVVRIKLVATLTNNAKIPIAEARSAAIIVRGRSPRNFNKKQEVPATGDKSAGTRKATQTPATLNRSSTTPTSNNSPLKREHSGENAFQTLDFDIQQRQHQNPVQGVQTTTDWAKPTIDAPTTSMNPTSAFTTPTLPSSKSPPSTSPPPAPQNFPFPTIDPDCKRPTQRPPKATRTTSKPSRAHPYKRPSLPSLSSTKSFLSAHSQNKLSSTSLDSADLLYEYFPLGADDWQQPVDAVYRPHVVHHITVAAGANDQRQGGLSGINKRYFSEDTATPTLNSIATTTAVGGLPMTATTATTTAAGAL